MNEIFASPYFGVSLSVIAFGIGVKLNQKFKTRWTVSGADLYFADRIC